MKGHADDGGAGAWTHARQLLAARGSGLATGAEIAAAVADLLDRAGQGPGPAGAGLASDAMLVVCHQFAQYCWTSTARWPTSVTR